MSEYDKTGAEAAEQARIERALTETLRPRSLDSAALERVRTRVAEEWRSVHPAVRSVPRTARWGRWVSLAAAVVLIALAAAWYSKPVSETYTFGTIARVDVGMAEQRVGFLHVEQLKSGDVLKTGVILQARGPVLVTLAGGGTLRVAADTALELTGPTRGVLRRGQIYVDLPPGTHSNGPFQIETRAGTVEHVGTEFEVISNDRLVRLRVREGKVQLGNIAADAGTELTALNDGTVTRGTIPTYGRDWLWVAALAPDYEIEGQPLVGFLEWVSRETGRPIQFADEHARAVAERTILHGSVRGREPLDALSSVLSTTSLTFEIRGDAIWIQSGHAT
jgi:ferric-dicitrate binding protein FerR (iron transport regulator)